MQPYHRPRRSFAGVLLGLFLVGGFLLFLLVCAAAFAGLFFSRARAVEQRAIAHEAQARAQMEQLRRLEAVEEMATEDDAEAAHGESHAHAEPYPSSPYGQYGAPAQPYPPPSAYRAHPGGYAEAEAVEPAHHSSIWVANREITVRIDAEGQVHIDGKAVEREQLEAKLREASEGRKSALVVTVQAAPECRFEHVNRVLSLCQELEITNVRIRASED